MSDMHASSLYAFYSIALVRTTQTIIHGEDDHVPACTWRFRVYPLLPPLTH